MPQLKLTGPTPNLTLYLEHPIRLDPKREYRLALTGFYADNKIHNLREPDLMYFWKNAESKNKDHEAYVYLHPKFYTIADLQDICRSELKKKTKGINTETFSITKLHDQVLIVSPMHFYMGPHLSRMLEFDPPPENASLSAAIVTHNYQANTAITGNHVANLRPIDVLEIHCDVID